jgi:hypothetical protein
MARKKPLKKKTPPKKKSKSTKPQKKNKLNTQKYLQTAKEITAAQDRELEEAEVIKNQPQTDKNREESKKSKKRTGSLKVEHYQSLLGLATIKQQTYDDFSDAWSYWGTIIEILEKKIRMLNSPKQPKAPKTPVQWKCLTCDKVHDKAESLLRCPDPECHSENIIKLSDWMKEQEQEIAPRVS